MYSAVLMLALTAGAETADHGRRCHDNACCGPVACSCGTYVVGCTGCSGCTTCHGCHGGLFHRRDRNCCCAPACSAYVCSGAVIYGCSGCAAIAPPPPMKKEMPKSGEKIDLPKKTGSLDIPATIIVSLPADARLTVDGASTSSTSDRRILVTPVLENGSTYVYTMQAEVVRDGRTMTQTQQVTVRGGETSSVQFNFASEGVASR